MSDEQWTQLNAIFADGVCDYSKSSQGYAELEGTLAQHGISRAGPLGVRVGGPRTGAPPA